MFLVLQSIIVFSYIVQFYFLVLWFSIIEFLWVYCVYVSSSTVDYMVELYISVQCFSSMVQYHTIHMALQSLFL